MTNLQISANETLPVVLVDGAGEIAAMDVVGSRLASS